MSAISYRIVHREKEITIVFQSIRHGEVSIPFKCINTPNGNRGVVYDCFNVTIGRAVQQISEVDEFADDLSAIMYLYENPVDYKQDFIISTFDVIINRHIRKYGRIIDTDLYSTIAQMIIVLNALAQNEPNRVSVNKQSKRIILEMLMERVEQVFGSYLYLTQYTRTPYGIQPSLVSFNDFKHIYKR